MRLKEIRKEKGLTTYDVGEALGVSPSAITNWETGFRRPDIDTLVKLAQVLGCTPNDLLGFERKEPDPEENCETVPEIVRRRMEEARRRQEG